MAIDADPAIGLSTALGVEIGKTVDDIRKDVIEAVKEGKKEDKISILTELDYNVLNAMVEKDGFAFLAIGRPESDGCYCKVNSYLKEIIQTLASHFDYVVIDGEAGIEQINRRVMETVTHLLLVSDASQKGKNVIRTISNVAYDLVKYEKMGVVLNRVSDEKVKAVIDVGDLEYVNYVPEDANINYFDVTGKSLLELPKSDAVTAIEEIMTIIGIL